MLTASTRPRTGFHQQFIRGSARIQVNENITSHAVDM